MWGKYISPQTIGGRFNRILTNIFYLCNEMQTVIIVEDDADIREILSFNVENAGYSVICADSAEAAEEFVGEASLILLDVMLPGMSGCQFAKKLRSEGNDVPIIFLTARTEENDILEGFGAGGDDYISKPFFIGEVLARIKAVLARTEKSDVVTVGGITVNRLLKTASINGRMLDLSRKEYAILELLVSNRGQCFSRAEIISRLWTEAPYVLERTVDVHIARLRSKLGDERNVIRNKSGFGYYV